MNLQGKAALITGAKRIGGVVVETLAKRGVDVALSYGRSKVEAEETVAAARRHGGRAEAFQADLTNPGACAALVERTVAAFGGLDILINMASVYDPRPFAEMTLADWHASMDVDLRATFLCSHAAAPHLRARGGGHIINFGDWLASSGRPRYPGYVSYYVAKAGVIALTEALALELAHDRIIVNAISPGPILAPPTLSPSEHEAVERATPLGRWGGELSIAQAVLGLLESDFITGETIRVDGGRHLK